MCHQNVINVFQSNLHLSTSASLHNLSNLGHGIQFHEATQLKEKRQMPLAVVIGWMGAKPNQLKPYLHFYHQNGIDTLSFAVGPDQVLFPRRAMLQMERVLTKTLEKAVKNKNPRDVIFHCFSMGGYLYGQSLRAIQGKPDLFGHAQNLIKAQIFDSPPDYNGIANGIAKSAGITGLPEKIAIYALKSYLTLTHNTAGVEHRASSAIFHQNYITAPSLWYYSKADPVANWKDCEAVITKWKARGTEVESCTWDDSPHIQHGRKYPEEYFGKLAHFLAKHNLIS